MKGLIPIILLLALAQGCASQRIEKVYVPQVEYIVLDIPEQFLVEREIPDEPKSHSRKMLVQWQLRVLSQLRASNNDKKALRDWLESSRKLWLDKNNPASAEPESK